MSLRSREYRLKKIYGLTLAQYDELLRKQEFCCAVCKKHYSMFKVSLSVEHNHETGEIRGLCCSYCEFKQLCWPNLRTFVTARGPKYYTKVVKEPKVAEAF